MRNVHVLKVNRRMSQCCTSAAASSLPGFFTACFRQWHLDLVTMWRNSFQRTAAYRRRTKYLMTIARPWHATLLRMLKPILVSKSKHAVSEYICREMSKMSNLFVLSLQSASGKFLRGFVHWCLHNDDTGKHQGRWVFTFRPRHAGRWRMTSDHAIHSSLVTFCFQEVTMWVLRVNSACSSVIHTAGTL